MTKSWMAWGTVAMLVSLGAATAATVEVDLSTPAALKQWTPVGGAWRVRDGALEQTHMAPAETSPDRVGHIFLKRPAVADFALAFQFRTQEKGSGVRAPEVLFRSTSSRDYYVVQFSPVASTVMMARATGKTFWADIVRRRNVPIAFDTWHTARVEATGATLRVFLDGKMVLEGHDTMHAAGLVGFGSSQGHVGFRNIRLTATPVQLPKEWKAMTQSAWPGERVVICSDAGAGSYQAFPDVVRLRGGDLLVVFYAGYEHVSFPRKDLPRGARVCSVRSRDGGKTWGDLQTVADTPWDDRDPSICQLADGTLICNWFTYYAGRKERRPGNPVGYKEIWLAFSTDEGKTWGEPQLIPSTANAYYGCTSPIRPMPDGTLIMPIYHETRDKDNMYIILTLMIFSRDNGKTWSKPFVVDPDNIDNDEADIIRRLNGDLLCVMRTNYGKSMWKSLSKDGGKTWTKSEPIGFMGHAPYLFRTSSGILLCGHRHPGTSLHYSLDDGATWSANVQIDSHIGAYPSMAELPDGRILFVYYDEGPGSAIRAVFLKPTPKGIEF